MGFRTLDINVSGKHADLIRDGKYEIYSADWLRSAVRMLMNQAYELGRQNLYPYDKEMQKNEGDGWKELHDEFNRRIDEMLDIGVQHVKENGDGACIDCEFFSDSEYYADNTVTACAVSWGSCTKCQRNITSTSPHTEVPSWCPLKGDEDER